MPKFAIYHEGEVHATRIHDIVNNREYFETTYSDEAIEQAALTASMPGRYVAYPYPPAMVVDDVQIIRQVILNDNKRDTNEAETQETTTES